MALVSALYGSDYSNPKKKKGKRLAKKQCTAKLAKTYADELKERATSAESAFKDFLDKYEFVYDFQKPFRHSGTFSIVDFYLPAYGVAVEIDGGYHSSPEQMLKDKSRAQTLMKVNNLRAVVRFTNEEVERRDDHALLKKLVIALVPQTKMLFEKETESA